MAAFSVGIIVVLYNNCESDYIIIIYSAAYNEKELGN